MLLGHGHHRLLVHADIVDAHAAEDGEGLHKVLVVLREREVVELRSNSSLIFNDHQTRKLDSFKKKKK